jgi:hypothetical protein
LYGTSLWTAKSIELTGLDLKFNLPGNLTIHVSAILFWFIDVRLKRVLVARARGRALESLAPRRITLGATRTLCGG